MGSAGRGLRLTELTHQFCVHVVRRPLLERPGEKARGFFGAATSEVVLRRGAKRTDSPKIVLHRCREQMAGDLRRGRAALLKDLRRPPVRDASGRLGDQSRDGRAYDRVNKPQRE